MNRAAKRGDAPDKAGAQVAGEHQPSVVFETDGFVMATWNNVAIHVWSIQATLALVDKLEELSTSFAAAHREGFSAVHIITGNAPLPPNDVRERLREVSDRFANDLACVGHVVEGSGFWASALQSFLTGLHWLSRRPFKLHIGSSTAVIAQWLPEHHAARTGVVFATDELEQAMHYVRGRRK